VCFLTHTVHTPVATSTSTVNKDSLKPAARVSIVAADSMNEQVRLKRQLGLLHGVGIVAGFVIGTGIYISPKGVILHAGSAGLSLVLWLVGGVLSMVGALTYAEIGLVIPQSGALYAYLRVMYGRFAGFLYIWSYFFFVRVGMNAIKCLIFGRYVLKPFFSDCPLPEIAVRLVATIVACKSASIDCNPKALSTLATVAEFGDSQLSVGPFYRPRPNPTHQVTDPTQPNSLPGEFMDPSPNPTHTQLNPHTTKMQ